MTWIMTGLSSPTEEICHIASVTVVVVMVVAVCSFRTRDLFRK
jgi:hypothetical protein